MRRLIESRVEYTCTRASERASDPMCARVGVRISISIDIPRPGSPVHRPRDRPHCPLDEHCAPAACLRASSSPLSSYPSLLRSLFLSVPVSLSLSLPPSLSFSACAYSPVFLSFSLFERRSVQTMRSPWRCVPPREREEAEKGATGKEGTVTRGISGRANLVAKVAAPSFTRYTRSIRRRVR